MFYGVGQLLQSVQNGEKNKEAKAMAVSMASYMEPVGTDA